MMIRLLIFMIAATWLHGTVQAQSQETENDQPISEERLAAVDPAMTATASAQAVAPAQETDTVARYATPDSMRYSIVTQKIDHADGRLIRADGPPTSLHPDDVATRTGV